MTIIELASYDTKFVNEGINVDMAIEDEIRNELIKLSGSTRTRKNLFTKQRPTRWSPYEVTVPGTIDVFTSVSAWEYIVKLLEDGTEVEKMTLDKPLGKIGYVMKVPSNNSEKIYIKLELAGGIVFGRSFHISTDKD